MISTIISKSEESEDVSIVSIEDDEIPVRDGPTSAMRKMREEEDQSLKAKIDALGADQDIVVKLNRLEPTEVRYRGERIPIVGLTATYSQLPTDQQVEDSFGGGTYQLKVNRSNGTYFGSKTFRIAGRPNIDSYIDHEEGKMVPVAMPTEDNALASQAMRTMQDLIDKGEPKSNGGLDIDLFNTMMAPVLAQVEASNQANRDLQRQLADKETRMLEFITQKPDTSKEDSLLKEVWNSDSRRLEAIRDQHMSEVRMMREHHEAALSRLDNRHNDSIKSAERAHEREIDSVKDSHKQAIDSLKLSFEARIDGLKAENDRLNRELVENKSEIGQLRSVKEKGLVEQATELAQVGDALKAIGIGGSEEKDEKWYEKAISAVADNPEIIAQFVGGPNAGPPQQQQQQQQQQQLQPQAPPIGQPFQHTDGQMYVRMDETTVVPLAQAQQIVIEKKKQAEEDARAPDPREVAIAIQFIEGAFSSGTSAEIFANTARASIPADILSYMEEKGVENFLSNVAKLDMNSPLRNIAGRKYMREVGNFLLKGQAE